jgi:hypothetical protein
MFSNLLYRKSFAFIRSEIITNSFHTSDIYCRQSSKYTSTPMDVGKNLFEVRKTYIYTVTLYFVRRKCTHHNIKRSMCTLYEFQKLFFSAVTHSVILPLSSLNKPAAVHLAFRPVALIPDSKYDLKPIFE